MYSTPEEVDIIVNKKKRDDDFLYMKAISFPCNVLHVILNGFKIF